MLNSKKYAPLVQPHSILHFLFLILLDQAVEQGLQALGTLLGVSLLVVHIVNKGHAETGLKALGPLVVVEKRLFTWLAGPLVRLEMEGIIPMRGSHGRQHRPRTRPWPWR